MDERLRGERHSGFGGSCGLAQGNAPRSTGDGAHSLTLCLEGFKMSEAQAVMTSNHRCVTASVAQSMADEGFDVILRPYGGIQRGYYLLCWCPSCPTAAYIAHSPARGIRECA